MPSGSVAGRVYEEESKNGVPDVVLEIALADENDRAVRQVVTDAAGRYHFKNLSGGNYELNRQKTPEGYQYQTKHDEVITVSVKDAEHRDGVDIALLKEIPLRGKVVTPNGFPISSLGVGLNKGQLQRAAIAWSLKLALFAFVVSTDQQRDVPYWLA